MKAFEAEKIVGQYQLFKCSGMSYRQVLRILHQLEKTGFLKLDHFERSSKGGKPQNFWRRIS